MNPRLTLSLLALPIAVACTDPSLTSNRAAPTNADVFDALWNEFDLRYSFFEVKGVNWDSMRVVHRPRAIAAENDAALARVLGTMITALQDRHVMLTTAGTASGMTFLSKIDSVLPRLSTATFCEFSAPPRTSRSAQTTGLPSRT